MTIKSTTILEKEKKFESERKGFQNRTQGLSPLLPAPFVAKASIFITGLLENG
jgi:hypothetical protein